MIKVQHRHVIKIYDFFTTGNYYAYVMERPQNCQDLGSLLFDRTMREKEARRYFAQIIEANIKCEENGFIHRDLKPENILVDLDLGSISAVSRVRSLILPEKSALSGDECGLIFPNSGW